MPYLDVIRKEVKPRVESLIDDIKTNKNPHYFNATGTQVYVGRQGSGKTLSAVKHMLDLKKRYPYLMIVSNLDLKDFEPVDFVDKQDLLDKIEGRKINIFKQYIRFSSMEQLEVVLTQVNNGIRGVIYLIDEIHTYFNALDSKSIPPFVFTEISQQRKQRKAIVGTSQLFLRMAKPFREQCDNMINCLTYFNFFTVQVAYDGMSIAQDYEGRLSGKKRKIGWFFRVRRLRNAYDTYQKVISSATQYGIYEELQPEPKKKGLLKK